MEKIRLGLGNEYGEAMAYEEDGKYFMELNGGCGLDIQEISEEFYEAIKKEFGTI